MKIAVAFVAVLSSACVAPTAGADLRTMFKPGYAPIVVASTREPVVVAAETGQMREIKHAGRIVTERDVVMTERLCETPCTLYAKPATTARLWIVGERGQPSVVRVEDVPIGGAAVSITPRSSSTNALLGALSLAAGVGGIGIGAVVAALGVELGNDPIAATGGLGLLAGAALVVVAGVLIVDQAPSVDVDRK